ncbi:MAG: NAD-dependent epimerase/dehydratase family protein [Streptosporangiales bacterium]|nr:NAD-dependent epimerase/dehydratase family protein [Streptosporangiales bacterium]
MTGGCGFIGRAVVQGLHRAGAEVSVVDQRPYPDASVQSVVGDLCDPSIRDAAVTPGLAGIVHLAAVTSVLASIRDPFGTYEGNVAVTAGLLELARERGVGRFILASTNAVTGNVGAEVITEDVPLRPLTPYGATKAACEMLLSAYASSYDLAATAVRLTNVYGPGMSEKDSFVPRLMRAALAGEGVQVYGDGEQRRDFVFVEDVVQAVLVAWGRRHSGPLIIGSGRSVTVNELVEETRRATGAPIPVTRVPAKPGEMPAVIVSTEQARALGYRPGVDLPEGLAAVWAYFQGAG